MAKTVDRNAVVLGAVERLDYSDLTYLLVWTNIPLVSGTWTDEADHREAEGRRTIATVLPGHPLPGTSCADYNSACHLELQKRRQEQWEVIE